MKRNWAGVARDVKRGYPLSDAAIKLVAWATHGVLRPSGDDFAMLRCPFNEGPRICSRSTARSRSAMSLGYFILAVV